MSLSDIKHNNVQFLSAMSGILLKVFSENNFPDISLRGSGPQIFSDEITSCCSHWSSVQFKLRKCNKSLNTQMPEMQLIQLMHKCNWPQKAEILNSIHVLISTHSRVSLQRGHRISLILSWIPFDNVQWTYHMVKICKFGITNLHIRWEFK